MSLFTSMEDEVTADIARRVKKTGRFTETAELQAKSMHELGYSPSKIQAEVMKMLRADKKLQMEIAENTKAYKQEVKRIIEETVEAAKISGNKLVAEAGTMAWNDDMQMWKEHGVDLKQPNTLSQLIVAFQKQTVNELKNLTRTMGFKGTSLGTVGILNMYQREMDLALLKVASGTFSYDQAVNDCVHRLAQSGLRSIDYKNNKTYQIDTAVRMSVRTGMSQLAGKVTEMNLEQTEHDLVITSQHLGSRPEHAPWQNKVFSYSGKSKKYPDFRTATGYGTAGGLKGVNCTHNFYPFWEGASIIPEDIKEPKPVIVDGKKYDYYQATQKQRSMERNIRALKREIEAQKAIGGDTNGLSSALRNKTAEYYSFSERVGIKAKANRLRVAKGTSKLNTDTYKAKSTKEKNVNRSKYDLDSIESRIKHDKIVLSEDIPQNTNSVNRSFKEIQEEMFAKTGTIVNSAENIDALTVQKISDRYVKLIEKNPHMRGFIQDIEFSDELSADVYAARKLSVDESGRVSRKIVLNRLEYSNMDLLEKKYAAGVKSGQFPKGTTVENILDHEFGHALADDMSLKIKGINLDEKLFEAEEWKSIKIGGKVFSKICVEDAAKKGKMSVKKLQGSISKYAKEEYSETFAEAFSSTEGSSPSKAAILIMEQYQKRMKIFVKE